MPDRRSVAIASDTRTVTERILERAAAVADQAEVFHVASASTPVKFEANQVKAVDSNEAVGAAVRIIKDGRVGFASTSNLDDIDDLVAAAEETAPFGAEAAFRFPGAADYPGVPVFDSAVEDVSLEEMVDIGRRVIDELRSFSSEVQVEGRRIALDVHAFADEQQRRPLLLSPVGVPHRLRGHGDSRRGYAVHVRFRFERAPGHRP